jgi:hypothetical protein
MASVIPVTSLDILQAPVNLSFSSPPVAQSTTNVSIQVSENGGNFITPTGWNNIENNAVPSAIDGYTSAFIGANTSGSMRFKIATGTGIGSQFGFILDLSTGIVNGESVAQASVSAGTNLAVGIGAGFLGDAVIGGGIFLATGTAATGALPVILSVILATSTIMLVNAIGASQTGDKNFNVGDALYNAAKGLISNPEVITKPRNQESVSFNSKEDGSYTSNKLTVEPSGKASSHTKTQYNAQDGSSKKTETTFNSTTGLLKGHATTTKDPSGTITSTSQPDIEVINSPTGVKGYVLKGLEPFPDIIKEEALNVKEAVDAARSGKLDTPSSLDVQLKNTTTGETYTLRKNRMEAEQELNLNNSSQQNPEDLRYNTGSDNVLFLKNGQSNNVTFGKNTFRQQVETKQQERLQLRVA